MNRVLQAILDRAVYSIASQKIRRRLEVPIVADLRAATAIRGVHLGCSASRRRRSEPPARDPQDGTPVLAWVSASTKSVLTQR